MTRKLSSKNRGYKTRLKTTVFGYLPIECCTFEHCFFEKNIIIGHIEIDVFLAETFVTYIEGLKNSVDFFCRQVHASDWCKYDLCLNFLIWTIICKQSNLTPIETAERTITPWLLIILARNIANAFATKNVFGYCIYNKYFWLWPYTLTAEIVLLLLQFWRKYRRYEDNSYPNIGHALHMILEYYRLIYTRGRN